MNGTDMADEVVDALVTAGKYNGLNASQIAALKVDMAVSYTAMLNYIIANLEINGVEIDTAALLSAPTALTPVPNDGGAVVSAQMVGNADGSTLSQNNDGTGLIA